MPLGLTAETALQSGEDSEIDGRRELERARAVLRQPGCLKTVSKKIDGKKTHTVTTYYRMGEDGKRVTRRESRIQYPTVSNLRVTISNSDGMWALGPGVGIKVPIETKMMDVDALIADM